MYSSSSLYASSYLPPRKYPVSSGLPPLSPRYGSPSRYSTVSSPSRFLNRTSAVSTSPRYSSGSTYVSKLPESWRSSLSSPTLPRRDSPSTLSRRPSFSGLSYRSGSVSSLTSPSSSLDTYTSSLDTYRPSSYSTYTPSTGQREWSPRTTRTSSISSVQSLGCSSGSSSGGGSSSYKSLPPRSDNKLAGRVGLHNLGNTCFMNAVLQCLCHTHPLAEYCKRGSFSVDLNHKSPTGGDLIKAFASLVNILWKDNLHNAVSPDNLKRELQKYAPRFAGCSQQDAQELLRYLLQGLHDDINRVTTKTTFRSCASEYATESQRATDSWRRYQNTDDSKIVDLFGGQLKSTLKCTECNHTSVTFDPFWDLSLPIPEGCSRVTLQQCFRLFTSPEYLEGAEKPMCERCKKKTRSSKQLEINKFPIVLVIHLKRFSSGMCYTNKLNVRVDCELTRLDLSQFASTSCSNSNGVYDLYGVVDHFGSPSSGHYTSKCKNPYTGEWNEFNDTMVVDASSSSLITDKAYLLFYEQTKGRRNSRL